jgi:hypothetical protein
MLAARAVATRWLKVSLHVIIRRAGKISVLPMDRAERVGTGIVNAIEKQLGRK